MKKFYQACYGKPHDSWEKFNCSSNISNDMIEFFQNNAIRNAPGNIDADSFRLDDKLLFEISSNDRIVEISKTDYSTKDSFGRQSMFVHAFLFDSNEYVLENPNNILTVSDDNFYFTFEKTSKIPSVLKQNESLTFRSAFNCANITIEQYIYLMAAVNFSLESDTGFSISIIYKGNLKQKKAIIYLILSSLPYSLRYKLSFSDADNFKNSNQNGIMFVEESDNSTYFYNIENGDTNIDFDEIQCSPERFPFLAALENVLPDNISAYEEYCKSISSMCNELNFSYFSDYKDLMIADLMLKYKNNEIKYKETDDKELTKMLNSFLRVAPYGKDLIDEYITVLLSEYSKRKISPNETIMKRLNLRCDKTNYKALVEVYKKMQMIVLIENGEDETIKFLNEQHKKHNGSYEEWTKIVSESGGELFVDKYYTDKFNILFDLNQVIELWCECKLLNNKTKLDSLIQNKLYQITIDRIKRSLSETNSFDTIYNEYKEIYSKTFNSECVEIEKFTDNFWLTYNIESFEFDNSYKNNIKEILNYSSDNSNLSIITVDLQSNMSISQNQYADFFCSLVDSVYKTNINESKIEKNNLYLQLRRLFELDGISENLKNNALSFVEKSLDSLKSSDLQFWFNVASINCIGNTKYKIIVKLILWNVDVFVNDELFDDYLNDSEITISLVLQLKDSCEKYLDNVNDDNEFYKMVKNRYSQLKKKKKAIEKEKKSKTEQFSNSDSETAKSKKTDIISKLFGKR